MGKKGVFGTTTNRFYGSTLYLAEKAGRNPGNVQVYHIVKDCYKSLFIVICDLAPGQYEIKASTGTKTAVRSVFQSTSKRFVKYMDSTIEDTQNRNNNDFLPFEEESLERQKFDGEVQVRKPASNQNEVDVVHITL